MTRQADVDWTEELALPYVRLCYRFINESFFQGPRRLLDYLVLYLEQGRYVLTVEGTEYELFEGEFALIQPGWLFTTRGYGQCIVPNTHLDFFYRPRRTDSFVTTPGMTSLEGYSELVQPRLNDLPGVQVPVKFKPKRPVECRDTLYRMIEHFKGNDLRSALQVQKLALELLLHMIGDNELPVSAGFAEQQFRAKMNAFFSFRLSAPLSVGDMAEHAGYSESHFSALFVRSFGTPPHRHLLLLRIERAKELLASTPLKLDLIADYCGFADAAHFSKVFKRETGLAPSAYRRRERGTT